MSAIISKESSAFRNMSATSGQTPPLSSITGQLTTETHVPAAGVDHGAPLPWDNPDNVISLETYTTVSIVSNCFAYPLLFLVGVPTNGLNCIVFWQQGLKDRMNLCLFCLALVDMVYLIVLVIQAASTFVTFADEVVGSEYFAKSLVYCLGVGWGLKAASGCITMLIAIERCFCVVRPFHVDTAMRPRTMVWLLVAIVTGTQLVQVIQPLAYAADSVRDGESGKIHWNIINTELYDNNKVIFDIVLVVLLPFIVPLCTFIVVSVTTAVTVIKLKMAAKWREEVGGHHQAALTPVLVFLSCVYIACTAPLVAVTLVRILIPDFSPGGRYSNICISTHMLGTVCSAVNSAVNFFAYFWMSSRYRQTLHALCGIKPMQKGLTRRPTRNSLSAEVNLEPRPPRSAIVKPN